MEGKQGLFDDDHFRSPGAAPGGVDERAPLYEWEAVDGHGLEQPDDDDDDDDGDDEEEGEEEGTQFVPCLHGLQEPLQAEWPACAPGDVAPGDVAPGDVAPSDVALEMPLQQPPAELKLFRELAQEGLADEVDWMSESRSGGATSAESLRWHVPKTHTTRGLQGLLAMAAVASAADCAAPDDLLAGQALPDSPDALSTGFAQAGFVPGAAGPAAPDRSAPPPRDVDDCDKPLLGKRGSRPGEWCDDHAIDPWSAELQAYDSLEPGLRPDDPFWNDGLSPPTRRQAARIHQTPPLVHAVPATVVSQLDRLPASACPAGLILQVAAGLDKLRGPPSRT